MRFGFMALSLGCFALACGRDNVLIVVNARGTLPDIDELHYSAWSEDSDSPLDSAFSSIDKLPQSFTVTVGRAARETQFVRIHVDGLFRGNPVASGDRIVDVTKLNTKTITLETECKGLVCSGLQVCDGSGDRAVCGRECTKDEGCANFLVGCGGVACGGVTDGGSQGQCQATSALDGDSDGLLDPQCALATVATSSADCDDTDNSIGVEGGKAECGSGRDHDCDRHHAIDEFEGCPSACTLESATSATSELFPGLEDRVLRVGVVRAALDSSNPGEHQRIAVVATANKILSIGIPPSEAQFMIDSIELAAGAIRDLVVAGRVVAAATSEGLLLAHLDAFGGLQQLGAPIQVPPGNRGDDAGLLAVFANEQTVWVNAPSFGLGAVDVSVLSSPIYLGRVDDAPASALAQTGLGILMATPTPDDNGNQVFSCQASALARPSNCEPVDWEALEEDIPLNELPMDEHVLALAARPNPDTDSDDSEILAVASVRGENSTLRLFVTRGNQRHPRDVVSLDGQVVSITIDDGAILAGTTSGAVHLLLQHVFMYGEVARDDDGNPLVLTVSAAEEACATSTCSEGMWGSTTPEGYPFAAVGIDNSLKVISFNCEP